jgi:hypothetical protein
MQREHKTNPNWAKLFIPSIGIVALLVLVAALTGCSDMNSEDFLAPGEGEAASPAAEPPSLADIQANAGLSAEKSAQLEPPHQKWTQAHVEWTNEYLAGESDDPPPIMGPGARELPVVGFVKESAGILDRPEMARMTGYLAARQEAHMRSGPHRRGGHGGGPGGMRGPLAEMDLTPEQRMEFMRAMMVFSMGMREAHEAYKAGSITEEELRARVQDLREALQAELERILGAEKYAEMKAAQRERMVERAQQRLEHLDEFYSRREEILTQVLQLDEEDAVALSGILGDAKTRHQEVLNQFIAGSMEPDEMFHELMTLRKETREAISALLDEEQRAILDALERLRPRHRMMRGPMV